MIVKEVVSHSQVLWVGIGCVRGTSQQLMEKAIQEVFKKNQLELSAIAGIATIDTKSDELGLLALCSERNLPLKFFSADVLRTVFVPNPNQVVEQVGTPSVAEAAALCAILDLPHLLVPKQIFRSSIQNQMGAVTIAVAQSTILSLSQNSL